MFFNGDFIILSESISLKDDSIRATKAYAGALGLA